MKTLPPKSLYHFRHKKDQQWDIKRGLHIKLSLMDGGLLNFQLVKEKELHRVLNYQQALDWALDLISRAGAKIVPITRPQSREFFRSDRGYRIYTVELGSPQSSHKIVCEAGTHGGEARAHFYTSVYSILGLTQSGELREKILDSAHFSFLLANDPDGFETETRAYADMSGTEMRTPPVVRLQHIPQVFNWDDINLVHGRALEEAKPERIRAIQQHYTRRFGPPTLYLSLHETVMPGSHLFYRNAGIMIIVHDYFPSYLREHLSRLIYPLSWKERLSRWVTKILPARDSVYIEDYLRGYPLYEELKIIRQYLEHLGLRTYEDKFLRVLQEIPRPYPEDMIPISRSIFIPSPFYVDSGIVLAPDYYVNNFGSKARTIETFSQSLSERVIQGMAFLDASFRVETDVGREALLK